MNGEKNKELNHFLYYTKRLVSEKKGEYLKIFIDNYCLRFSVYREKDKDFFDNGKTMLTKWKNIIKNISEFYKEQ